MKRIILLTALFCMAITASHAQRIAFFNTSSYPVYVRVYYSTSSSCSTDVTNVTLIPALTTVVYQVANFSWTSTPPSTGGIFTQVDFSDDGWATGCPAHGPASTPCGVSPLYDEGTVGNTGFCSVTTTDCFTVDPANTCASGNGYTPSSTINAAFGYSGSGVSVAVKLW
jgi:hypothetical protein